MSEMLENVVAISNGRLVTTSVKVAIIFGKQHRRVMQSIRELEIPEELRRHDFVLSSYEQVQPNGGTKRLPMYEITRDGFTLLAMGFNGKKAMQFKLAYIQAFNAMEKELKNPRRRRVRVLDEDIESLRDTISGLREVADALNRAVHRLQRTVTVSKKLLGTWHTPESWWEVEDFCMSERLQYVNPKKFFNYYESRYA